MNSCCAVGGTPSCTLFDCGHGEIIDGSIMTLFVFLHAVNRRKIVFGKTEPNFGDNRLVVCFDMLAYNVHLAVQLLIQGILEVRGQHRLGLTWEDLLALKISRQVVLGLQFESLTEVFEETVECIDGLGASSVLGPFVLPEVCRILTGARWPILVHLISHRREGLHVKLLIASTVLRPGGVVGGPQAMDCPETPHMILDAVTLGDAVGGGVLLTE